MTSSSAFIERSRNISYIRSTEDCLIAMSIEQGTITCPNSFSHYEAKNNFEAHEELSSNSSITLIV